MLSLAYYSHVYVVDVVHQCVVCETIAIYCVYIYGSSSSSLSYILIKSYFSYLHHHRQNSLIKSQDAEIEALHKALQTEKETNGARRAYYEISQLHSVASGASTAAPAGIGGGGGGGSGAIIRSTATGGGAAEGDNGNALLSETARREARGGGYHDEDEVSQARESMGLLLLHTYIKRSPHPRLNDASLVCVCCFFYYSGGGLT